MKQAKVTLPDDAQAALDAGYTVAGKHRQLALKEGPKTEHIPGLRYVLISGRNANGKDITGQVYLHKIDGIWQHVRREKSERLLQDQPHA